MSSAWLLPEHIADVLPAQARRIEELRRSLLDRARGYGFELIMPPMLEHLDSLLTGTGHELDLRTFKLVDQLSGRTLGLRADTTPQAARIDAHLLNRQGVTRLCYCGPVLHTRPSGLGLARAAAVRRRDLRPCRPGGRPRSAGAGARCAAIRRRRRPAHRPGRCARGARRAGRVAHRGGAIAGGGGGTVEEGRGGAGIAGAAAFPPTRGVRCASCSRCTAARKCWPPRGSGCRSAR